MYRRREREQGSTKALCWGLHCQRMGFFAATCCFGKPRNPDSFLQRPAGSVFGAFSARRPVGEARVLVDDVMTTGATVNSARVLMRRRAGGNDFDCGTVTSPRAATMDVRMILLKKTGSAGVSTTCRMAWRCRLQRRFCERNKLCMCAQYHHHFPMGATR